MPSGSTPSRKYRRVYDLRHPFATFAHAGISTFGLSRYMGASLTMIDRHYGHLARGGREHATRWFACLVGGRPSSGLASACDLGATRDRLAVSRFDILE